MNELSVNEMSLNKMFMNQTTMYIDKYKIKLRWHFEVRFDLLAVTWYSVSSVPR